KSNRSSGRLSETLSSVGAARAGARCIIWNTPSAAPTVVRSLRRDIAVRAIVEVLVQLLEHGRDDIPLDEGDARDRMPVFELRHGADGAGSGVGLDGGIDRRPERLLRLGHRRALSLGRREI